MKLGIVIPCYNEEEVLPETIRQMIGLVDRLVSLGKISIDSRIFFVDDGSEDRTWALIEQYSAKSRYVAGIKLSRNRGHQNALIAGLFTAEGDALVSTDADLQDDINAIEEMVDRFLDGTEIVYGVRKRRETDTAFKRLTAEAFYKLIWNGRSSCSATVRAGSRCGVQPCGLSADEQARGRVPEAIRGGQSVPAWDRAADRVQIGNSLLRPH